jgi:hypothetical protein
MGKLKIELNDLDNLRDLLQETYNLANEQIVQAQNEINKLSNATRLQDEAMDAKSKYSKAINDYLGMKDKAIAKKLDIAKILSDIYSHNGNVKDAFEEGSNIKAMDFNFDDIKKMVDESYQDKEKTKTIELNKK